MANALALGDSEFSGEPFKQAAPGQSASGDQLMLGDTSFSAEPFGAKTATQKNVVAAPAQPTQTVRGETKPEEPELTWAQTASGAAKNLLPSTGKVFTDLAHAATNPGETWEGIKSLGRGVSSKVQGAVGVQQEPEQKARDETVVNALMDHYAQTYGTMKGFKKAAATDPASVLMDVTTPLTMLPSGGAALGVSATSATGKALKIASEVGRLANPVDDAIRLAGLTTKAVTVPARAALAGTSGVPMSIQKIASEAGKTADPKLREAYLSFARGEGDVPQLFRNTEDAIKGLRQSASDEFMASKAGQSVLGKKPNWQPIEDAIAKAREEVTIGSSRHPSAFENGNKMLDEIEALVAAKKVDPSAQTLLEIDRLKRSIYDIGEKYGGARGSPAMMVYDGTKQTLRGISKEYDDLMQYWQKHMVEMKDLTTLLGQSGRGSASAALAKMMKAMKTPQGESLIAKVAEVDKTIPYMIAGATVSPLFRQGIVGQLAGYGGIGTMIAHPGIIPHVAGVMAASSPRLTGAANYYGGKLGRAAEGLTPPKVYAANLAATLPTMGQAGEQAPSANTGDIDHRRIMAESNGQQFDKDGNPLRSRSGALGAAQVMPGTGPEAARLAGEEWSLDRLMHDRDYNMKLGQAYFDKQMQDFGDVAAALAAYNAGPGATRKALNEAKKTGRHFLSFLKPETQDYVAKILRGPPMAAHGGRINRASGGRIVNHAALAAQLISQADRSKKANNKNTEPLLDEHDDTIVHALKVANDAI